MKQSWICSALLAVTMCGCSSDDGMTGNGGDAEIKIGATVYGTITKAPVTTGDEFTAAITAFEGTSEPIDWTVTPNWQNSVTLTAAETSAGNKVPLNTSKTYPINGNVYMAAWHPDIASVGGVVTFKKTGTEDIMWGGIVNGSKMKPVGAFAFTHALTQLVFQVQASDAYMGNSPKAVKAIKVQGAQYAQSMTIKDGGITYAPAAEVPVPGAPETPLALTTTLVKFGEPLMINTLDGVKVKITYGDDTVSKEITIKNTKDQQPLKALAGNSHLISLVFQKSGEVTIEGTASVAPWKQGAEGSGTVE